MDGIKIEVTGNIARVIERPARITAGTVGLPVEFSFDNQWEGLSKTAVFKAGCTEMIVENLDVETIAPWETTANPNVWLSIGVYGVNADGSVAIPTIWANVCVICEGTNPEGDVSTAPTPPVWQRLWNAIGNLLGLTTNAKGNLVEAINEVNSIALAGGIESDPTLTQSGKAADAKATGDKIKSLTATDVGARPSDWIPTAEEVGARPSDWMPTAEDVGARPNTWLPTIADIGASPAGYGLGLAKLLTSADDINTIKANGWYYWNSNSKPKNIPTIPSTNYMSCMRVWTNDGGICLQEIADMSDSSNKGLKIQRTIYGSTVYDWEWVNPSMILGIEYRTTERYNGLPVYTKLIQYGALPDNGESAVPHGIAPLNMCLRYNLTTGSTNAMLNKHANITGVSVSATNVIITTNSNISWISANVQLWYVK